MKVHNPKLPSKGSLAQSSRSTLRRCDLCDENIMAEEPTGFVTIKGIPGKRHEKCIQEARNG